MIQIRTTEEANTTRRVRTTARDKKYYLIHLCCECTFPKEEKVFK